MTNTESTVERTQSATVLLFGSGLLAIAVGLGAKAVGVSEIAGLDPVVLFAGLVVLCGELWLGWALVRGDFGG